MNIMLLRSIVKSILLVSATVICYAVVKNDTQVVMLVVSVIVIPSCAILLYVPEKVYWYKDKPYIIRYKSNIKIDGEWHEVVIYKTKYKNVNGTIWVRLKTEFYELFKPKVV